MTTIGARMGSLRPGFCEIDLPFRRDLCQQHGFLHAGITTTIADSAAGYAAFSLMPRGSSVLTVEFKVNLMAPAAGDVFLGRGKVIKPGRTLLAVEAEVIARGEDGEKAVAQMLATMMCLADKADATAGG